MPTKKINIENGNIAIFGFTTTFEEHYDCWKQVNDFFRHRIFEISCFGFEFKVSLDFSDAILYLDDSEGMKLGKGRPKREEEGKHRYGNDVVLEFEWQGEFEDDKLDEVFCFIVCRFFQQVFVAGNLHMPGSVCALRLKTKCLEDLEISDLSPHFYATALDVIEEDKWPNLTKISFEKAWNWLDNQNFMLLDYATTPCSKALFTFLKIGNDEAAHEDLILYIARALEALFVDGNENCGRLLKERLHIVLGEPEINKKWISKYYSVRSKIAHGDAEMTRPNLYDYNDDALDHAYEAKNKRLMEKGVSAIIAILQDLIENDSTEYIFEQAVSRK